MNLLFFPFQSAPALILIAVIILAFALAAFALPLWVVSMQLVQDKRAFLTDHQHRVEASLASLNHKLVTRGLVDIDKMETALAVLAAERKLLDDIPTLPWRTSTLNGFLSAAILPIILLLVRQALERWIFR